MVILRILRISQWCSQGCHSSGKRQCHRVIKSFCFKGSLYLQNVRVSVPCWHCHIPQIWNTLVTLHSSLFCLYIVVWWEMFRTKIWRRQLFINCNRKHGVWCLGNVKVKQYLYRPGQPLSVPRGWGSQMSIQSAHEGGKVVSPVHLSPLRPRKYSWYPFC